MTVSLEPGTTGYALPTYPAVIPEAVRTGATERHRVVIVGAGLTGLTLAADLSLRGIEAVVLDDDDTVGVRGASSRGMVYSQKTLEIMDRLGVFGRIDAKGVQWSVGRTLSGHDVVYTFDRARDSRSKQPPFCNIQQYYVEWYLVERVAELGRAQLRWRNEVVGVENGADGVRLEVATPEGRYTIVADRVVDAGGANSFVRTALGLDSHPARSEDRWCICDVRFSRPMTAERWTWVDAPFNGGRAVWQHVMADEVWRLDYQLDPDSDPGDAASLEVATARVREHLGPGIDFELVWVGPWQYRTQLLDEFVMGRVLFAGDAAHVMSPFGARGGNSGVQDAENLGWKLALVLGGQAPEALLRSYSIERRAAAAENIRITTQSARFLAPRSEFERRLRTAAIDLARRHPFARTMVNTGRLTVPNEYPGSPVIAEGGGACLPNLPVGEGRHLMDAVAGNGLLGLYVPRGPDDRNHHRIAEAAAGVPATVVPLVPAGAPVPAGSLSDASGEILRLASAGPGDFLAVRPDLYCAGVVRHTSPHAAAALLRFALAIGETP